MKIIQKLSDLIEEELGDAEKYIVLAMTNKEDSPTLAATFYKLSTEEMGHVMMLHEQVVAIISEYRRTNGDPPIDMQSVYDYLHKRHIEKANEIRIQQALYKSW